MRRPVLHPLSLEVLTAEERSYLECLCDRIRYLERRSRRKRARGRDSSRDDFERDALEWAGMRFWHDLRAAALRESDAA